MNYGIETGRVKFMVNRDGLPEAKKWAAMVIGQYRTAVLFKGDENRPPHHATYREFRRSFIESYVQLKRFYHGIR